MQNTIERLRQRKVERGSDGGFTLIELLIVIVVLGILAAIVVFAVQNLTGSSAQSSCKADFKTVETAAESYKAQVGSDPAAIGNLMTPVNGNGPWLKELPATNHYQISVDGNGNTQVAVGAAHPASTGSGNCQYAA
jgi:general secretion pathway protein G